MADLRQRIDAELENVERALSAVREDLEARP